MNKTEMIERVVKIKFLVKDSDTVLALRELDNLLEKLCSSSTVDNGRRPTVKSHKDTCLVELDPYGGPCTCGRDKGYDDIDFY
jgi:hypothetical protein